MTPKQIIPKPPKWIIPLLAEPVEESWRRIYRRATKTSTICQWNTNPWRPTLWEDRIEIPVGTRPVD